MKYPLILAGFLLFVAIGCGSQRSVPGVQSPQSDSQAITLTGVCQAADILDDVTAQELNVDLIMKAAWLQPDDFPVPPEYGGMWKNRRELAEEFAHPKEILGHMQNFGVKGAWEAQVHLQGYPGWNITVQAVFTAGKACGWSYGNFFGMSGERLAAASGLLPHFVAWEFLDQSQGFNQALIVTEDGTVFLVADRTLPESRLDVRALAEALAERYREEIQAP